MSHKKTAKKTAKKHSKKAHRKAPRKKARKTSRASKKKATSPKVITITAKTIMKRVCRSKHVPVSLRKYC